MTELFLRIPRERIGILLGPRGSVKQSIEKATNTKLELQDCSVRIWGEDAEAVIKVGELVKAVGRGFSLDQAWKLLQDDFLMLEILEIPAKSSNDLVRIRGRLIGQGGRARRAIERYTQTMVSIYGKTVGIIGYPEQLELARQAIQMLVSGSPHGAVLRFLERSMAKLKARGWAERDR